MYAASRRRSSFEQFREVCQVNSWSEGRSRQIREGRNVVSRKRIGIDCQPVPEIRNPIIKIKSGSPLSRVDCSEEDAICQAGVAQPNGFRGNRTTDACPSRPFE